MGVSASYGGVAFTRESVTRKDSDQRKCFRGLFGRRHTAHCPQLARLPLPLLSTDTSLPVRSTVARSHDTEPLVCTSGVLGVNPYSSEKASWSRARVQTSDSSAMVCAPNSQFTSRVTQPVLSRRQGPESLQTGDARGFTYSSGGSSLSNDARLLK